MKSWLIAYREGSAIYLMRQYGTDIYDAIRPLQRGGVDIVSITEALPANR